MSMVQLKSPLGDGNISPDVDLSRLLDQRWKKQTHILSFGPCHRWFDCRQPGGGCLAAFDCVGRRHLGIRGKLERVAAGHAELEGSKSGWIVQCTICRLRL